MGTREHRRWKARVTWNRLPLEGASLNHLVRAPGGIPTRTPGVLRQLVPVALSDSRELRLNIMELNGHPWVRLTTWTNSGSTSRPHWILGPGGVDVPVGLLPELVNRLRAAQS